ncbi:Cell division protein FtsQ [Aliiroseovarius sp. xm-m-379]|uniref:cell division protein FtsQ/DivIB n=1 Tax=unclassified Aliiroseovarius TaxID=2623558 RepID=UPI001568DBF5|nr:MULTISPECIES: cell division protein FtsQ/DivIB [unclassified Aliiroseovarius]NRP11725.1 Cell division protein FtsQ [Aliiroseovarius sp. xm-d-517]NRP25662.1 Cell division protein FtsQ [Aliiroseovarius sp. xm-m-379]NRP31168.1 Cell division protein FtsQ [Aliiroseovarius sp. xm-m-314]NRP34461.1 Cell division protein FtsQ [Aliiroseovarius sp. xm-a-104]NRP41896.1 Cell division protein FtsQ [Aliiroseovarius sp. xm-m-339-2]
MQSLTHRSKPPVSPSGHGGAPARRDPAPSRIAYKINRLWLTPLFRATLRVGLPVFLILLMAGWYFSNPTNRYAIGEKITDIKRSVQERPEFMVKLMAVEGASPIVDDAVRVLLPIDFPISSFDLDLEVMREEIMKLDVVANAELRIRPGGVLEVVISERDPVVVWRSQGQLELLDRSGHRVASLTARAARADLPMVAGAGADKAVDEALRIIATAGPLADRLRGLVRVGERRWDLMLTKDQRIMLPENQPVFALEQVLALDQAQDLLARNVTAIDMRTPLRPTLRLGSDATEELRRIRGFETEEATE